MTKSTKPKGVGRAAKAAEKPVTAETKKAMFAEIQALTKGRAPCNSKEGRERLRAEDAAVKAEGKKKQVRNTSGLRPPWKKGQSGNPESKNMRGNRFMRINRLTAEERKRMADEYGVTPLEFLLSIVADDEDPMEDRQQAAKACLPYLHSRKAIRIETAVPPDEAAELIRAALEDIDAVTSSGKIVPVMEKPIRKAVRKAASK